VTTLLTSTCGHAHSLLGNFPRSMWSCGERSDAAHFLPSHDVSVGDCPQNSLAPVGTRVVLHWRHSLLGNVSSCRVMLLIYDSRSRLCHQKVDPRPTRDTRRRPMSTI